MSSSKRESIAPPREVLVNWLARLYRHGLTTTTGGNLSLIDDDGTIYITPSGGDKAIVPPENVAVRPPGSKAFGGPLRPSMEWPLHTAAYRVRPECRAVLHAHSATLVAFSLSRTATGTSTTQSRLHPLDFHPWAWDVSEPPMGVPDTRCLLGAWSTCGRVALSPYALPGSDKLADDCAHALEKGADCVILQNHGVVTVGATLQQAYDRFVTLEYLAQSIVHALPLGVPKCLPLSILNSAKDKPAAPHSCSQDNLPHRIPVCSATKRCNRAIPGTEKEARAELCKYVARSYVQNLITSSSGSFSVRVDNSSVAERDQEEGTATKKQKVNPSLSFLVTPTNVDRNCLESADICYVSNVQEGGHDADTINTGGDNAFLFHPYQHVSDSPGEPSVRPSRAAEIHAAIYQAHPDISCIMIVQPSYATAFCITGESFDAAGIPESHLVLRDVQLLPITALENGGKSIAQALNPTAGKHTVLIAGFGLLTVGSNLLKTFVQAEVCESMCGVMLTALRRGPVALLDSQQVKAIDTAFKIDSH